MNKPTMIDSAFVAKLREKLQNKITAKPTPTKKARMCGETHLNLVSISAILVFLFLTIGSLVFSSPVTNVIFKYLLAQPDLRNIEIVLFGLLLSFLYFFGGGRLLNRFHISTKILLKVTLAFNFALCLIVVLAFRNMSLGADASALLQPLKSEFLFSYLSSYTYQIPTALFNSLFVHFLGIENTILFLRILNCFLISLSIYFLFKITHSLFVSDSVDRIFLMLVPLFWQLSFYSTFAYTTIFVIAFSTVATFFMIEFFKTGARKHCAFALIFIFLALSSKPIAAIFVIAFIILTLFLKDRIITRILIVLFLLCLNSFSSFLFQNIYSAITHNKIHSQYIASTNIALAIGAICTETECEGDNFYHNYGYWTSEYNVSSCIHKYGADGCKDETNLLLKNRLQQFYHYPAKTATFFFEKTKFNWFNPDFGSAGDLMDKGKDYVMAGYIPNSRADELILGDLQGVNETKTVFRHRLLLFMDVVCSLIFLGALIFAISSLREIHSAKKVSKFQAFQFVKILPSMIFCGGFLFTLISETGSRYAFCFLPIILPLSAFGINCACETFSNLPILKRASASHT